MQLPDLAGQPGWVVAVVVVTYAAASSVALIRERRRKPEDKAGKTKEVEGPATSKGDTAESATVMFALQHITDMAKREAQENGELRDENEELRRKLTECERDRADFTRKALEQPRGRRDRGN